ncbi:hypothetical protein SNEBB_004865 [Seison nebaliae]|nr:hypothetical protein SNEBB_004865 [Seison nebaliae]
MSNENEEINEVNKKEENSNENGEDEKDEVESVTDNNKYKRPSLVEQMFSKRVIVLSVILSIVVTIVRLPPIDPTHELLLVRRQVIIKEPRHVVYRIVSNIMEIEKWHTYMGQAKRKFKSAKKSYSIQTKYLFGLYYRQETLEIEKEKTFEEVEFVVNSKIINPRINIRLENHVDGCELVYSMYVRQQTMWFQYLLAPFVEFFEDQQNQQSMLNLKFLFIPNPKDK